MRYHYELTGPIQIGQFAKTYICDHPVYNRCTLYKIKKDDAEKGLAVIQQRFNSDTKTTYWSEIDLPLIDTIYLKDGFPAFFDKFSGVAKNGLYPTVTVRQIMWSLRMKPLKKERWETCFDHKDI